MSFTFKALTTHVIKRNAVSNLQPLARGGVADVFQAENEVGLPVVVRRLRRDCRFRWRLRRGFVHGIRVRRQLAVHENIAQYIAQSGWMQPFEVIEYVPGESLKTLILRKNRLVRNQPAALLRQAAAAIVHTHRRGFIHLDIKSENYLVRPDGDRGIVKLSDFDTCLPVGTTEAPTGFVGTTNYLPPEIFRDRSLSIATDFFAFGVMAFNMLTFDMPFEGHVTRYMDGDSLPIVFPASAPVSAPLRELVLRCLHPDPTARFADDEMFWDAVVDALDRHEEQQS
jgi:serine/threonine-protein kinase